MPYEESGGVRFSGSFRNPLVDLASANGSVSVLGRHSESFVEFGCVVDSVNA